ncbi:MAG: DUF4982 domain-containing protein [Butyrivibrio sp.]|nr:DUF4982 domain-containing protein [Butyrivibrio sp.]
MKYLFDGDWKFLETGLDADFDEITSCKDKFEKVEIPHDWLIYDSTDLYRDGIGWYSKDFEYKETGKRCFITFEGVYMDSEIYVNGQKAFEWKYGYSSFSFEMTGFLKNGLNNITVSCRYQSPNTRWYSGAGIYRDVYLEIKEDTFIPVDGVYISSKASGDDFILNIDTEVCGKKDSDVKIIVDIDGLDIEQTNECVTKNCEVPDCDLSALKSGEKRYLYSQEYLVKNPKRWNMDEPNLYNIKVMLTDGESVLDEYKTRIGFKEIELSPDKGFIINGQNIKLHGVCEHHDLGALGSAYNSTAMKRKLKILKSMGVNALRGTHNMVAPNVLDLLDEMGFVFISEAFDMWRKPKTAFDYARFFDEWHKRDVASWVRRDRNHVCVCFWSIGNEIYDTHADEDGQRITKELKELVKKYDPRGNGWPTIGSNYMPWENARKCADILKIAGYNYAEKYYEEHHKLHPDWVIYGSETASVVQSRGIYHFPASAGVLSDDDQQCSSLGNSSTSWGAPSIAKCIKNDRDIPFSMGQFIWTGFDYIGEPTPYHTKNSYFGQIDTAGFPKDAYYEWQGAWTDYKKSPMVHICPYWDFNEGQSIDVRVFTNAPKARLSLNGKSFGEHEFSNMPGSGDKTQWVLNIPYEKGSLLAEALDENGNVIATDIAESFGDSKKIVVKTFENNTRLKANGRDLIFAEISTVDNKAVEVRNSQSRVKVSVSGPARLVGLDNGDSSDLDSYKSDSRRLFSGKLLAIIESTYEEGDISVKFSSQGLEGAELFLTSVADDETVQSYEDMELVEENGTKAVNLGMEEEIPVRKIELVNESGNNVFDKNNTIKKVSARVLPDNATYKDIEFQVVTEYGVKSNIAEIEVVDNTAIIKAKGDGRFYLRALSRNGSSEIRLISYLDFTVKDMGQAFFDPYDFVAGSLYSSFEGEVGNGNEKGFATARGEKTVVTFEGLDFGRDNGDVVKMPIFALDGSPSRIKLWSDGELIADEVYDREPMWNVYQDMTFKLSKKLTGICNLSIETMDKLHIKGFEFVRNLRAFEEHRATDADEIYGDTFNKTQKLITDIGNNVSIVFKDMDFGDKKPSEIIINGRAKGGRNTVHILFDTDKGSSREILEIEPSEEICEHRFKISDLSGSGTVTFVFLPGSNFDIESFRFL